MASLSADFHPLPGGSELRPSTAGPWTAAARTQPFQEHLSPIESAPLARQPIKRRELDRAPPAQTATSSDSRRAAKGNSDPPRADQSARSDPAEQPVEEDSSAAEEPADQQKDETRPDEDQSEAAANQASHVNVNYDSTEQVEVDSNREGAAKEPDAEKKSAPAGADQSRQDVLSHGQKSPATAVGQNVEATDEGGAPGFGHAETTEPSQGDALSESRAGQELPYESEQVTDGPRRDADSDSRSSGGAGGDATRERAAEIGGPGQRSNSHAAVSSPGPDDGIQEESNFRTDPTVESRPAQGATADTNNSADTAPTRFAEQLAPRGTESGAGTGPLDSAQHSRLLERVTRAFQAAQGRGAPLRLRLHPPELGSLRVEITVRHGTLTAHLETETASARSALLENLPVLRERLLDHGVRIDQFEVDLGEQSLAGSADHMPHERNDGQRTPPASRGPRIELAEEPDGQTAQPRRTVSGMIDVIA